MSKANTWRAALALAAITGIWLFVERDRAAEEAAPPAASTTLKIDAVHASLGGRTPAAEASVPLAGDTDSFAQPRNAEELQSLVRWMKSLPREQLLLLTNAEFGFKQSDLLKMLQTLEGDWVIPEMQRLALREADELVQATLVKGLFGSFVWSRVDDPRLLDAARALLPSFVAAASDPFGVAGDFASAAHGACLRQKRDLGAFLLPFLQESDNGRLLPLGYMFVGTSGGSESAIADAFLHHSHPSGRFGALEGLRHNTKKSALPPDELARLGVEALKSETSANNRLLIVEMLGSTGGDAGIDALRGIVTSKQSDLLASAATMLASSLPPDEALETISSALDDRTLSDEDRGALYQALGAIESPATGERLLGVAHDPQRSDVERLQGLQGLWHRPMDDDLSRELTSILESDAPASVRAESLKMLVVNSESAAHVDVKSLAVSDADPAVRREAVLLGALEGGPDAHGWLEERLLTDNSPDVKAAALGALVLQAHYSGESGAVLDHLGLARKLTNDAQVLDLIAQGEQMVRSYDPRRFELELQADADFYGTLSKYLSGPAQRDMQRRARYLEKMVTALRPR